MFALLYPHLAPTPAGTASSGPIPSTDASKQSMSRSSSKSVIDSTPSSPMITLLPSSSSSSSPSTSTHLSNVDHMNKLCTTFLQCCESDANAAASSSSSSSSLSSTVTVTSSSSQSSASVALAALRTNILLTPMPITNKTATGCSLRGLVWQLFLGVNSLSSSSYLDLVSRGPITPSALYAKIRGDCFRTFRADTEFWDIVDEGQMSRVLNAFVWKQRAVMDTSDDGISMESPFTYLQGMNAICGTFLYCMSELDAFYAFTSFITISTPLYWVSSHIGANAGCKLVDTILSVVDPTLASHLASTTPGAYVYAFHCVSGFCSTIRPLSEVMKLWDFLLAFGPHLNVLCVAAQVVSIRLALLAAPSPKAILDYRVWPPLDAKRTIALAMSFLPRLPTQLYEHIRLHATDVNVAEEISDTKMHEKTKGLQAMLSKK